MDRLELDRADARFDPSPPPRGGRPDPADSKRSGAATPPSNGSWASPGGSLADVHALDHLRVLAKRRWTAVTAFLLVFGTTLLVTFTATPIYEARVQLLIESRDQQVVTFQQVLDENRTANDYYQTQYSILQSRVLARRTLEAEDLWTHTFFTGEGAGGVGFDPVSMAAAAYSWGRSFFSPQEPERPADDETDAQSVAIDRLLRAISVTPIRNSRLVDVRVATPDPRLSARIANAHARQYIEQNLEFRFMATQEASEWLAERMAEQRSRVEESEVALQKYREQNDAVSLEDRQNIVVQRLADLNAAVTRARTERIQKQSDYEQVASIQQDRAAIDTHPAILSNTFVQSLKVEVANLQRQIAQMGDTLGERHPDMIKVRSALQTAENKLDGEIAKVVQSLRNDYQVALAQERTLTASLEQQKQQALQLNRQSIQYGVLQRDATTNRQIFDSLLQRTRETSIAGDLKVSNVRVVDEAEEPRGPARPQKAMNILFGLVGGLLLGVGLAFLFEYLDARIKSPEEIRTQLGLPYLGLVPALSLPDKSAGAMLLTRSVPVHFVEALRTIRTNVIFSSAEDECRTVVVTSTAPGEGKTMIAANLAVAMAMAGQRVLLIDGDMRRPKVHELFEQPQEPGLSNILVGDAKASEVVRRSAVQNLWVLSAGRHPPNPAELLGSRRFGDFVRSLSDHFDWIVMDSPPVLAVTDAQVLAHLVTGVVFVVGSEMIERGSIRNALDLIDAAQGRYLGAVLNRVDLDRNPYYYQSYYRREYSRYYSAAS